MIIDKNSPLPIYYQLESHIKGLIEQGNLNPGDTLPSEREYAQTYQISRMTVRQAINSLVNEGLLYRKKGSGTFVSERKIEQPLKGLTSFTEDMKKRGMVPSSMLLHFEVVPATSFIANQLRIVEGDPVYEIKRIRLADEVPMALETNYLSTSLVKGLSAEIVQASIYSYIEENLGFQITRADQLIEATIASSEEAKLLHIPKDHPMLFIQRNTYLSDGTPLELVFSRYRGDRYKFFVEMER